MPSAAKASGNASQPEPVAGCLASRAAITSPVAGGLGVGAPAVTAGGTPLPCRAGRRERRRRAEATYIPPMGGLGGTLGRGQGGKQTASGRGRGFKGR